LGSVLAGYLFLLMAEFILRSSLDTPVVVGLDQTSISIDVVLVILALRWKPGHVARSSSIPSITSCPVEQFGSDH
jgi:hypothetical protein